MVHNIVITNQREGDIIITELGPMASIQLLGGISASLQKKCQGYERENLILGKE